MFPCLPNISDLYVSGVEKLLVSRTSAEVWQVLQDIRDEIFGFVRYYPELFCVSLQFMAVTFTIHIIYLPTVMILQFISR